MSEATKSPVTMEKIESLCKRRGFVFPGSEIYGGLANSWDYGPYGAQLKKNIKDHWWKFFVERRDDMVGLDAAIIMNPKTWEASGHVANFTDPLTECGECHERFRADQVDMSLPCPHCGKGKLVTPKTFNLMLKTFLGPTEETADIAYLRPETAQAIFVDFPSILNTSRKKLPFGVAQIGKAFRNEITPGNFIFRTREFEQMEIEYFFDPKKSDWNERFDHLKEAMEAWMKAVGISSEKTHAVEIPDGERAHYSKRTIDFEFEYPFGQKELFGLAYRGDYDLSQHEKMSGREMRYLDPETNEKVLPHVIEPSLGVDRALLAILLSVYREETVKEGDERVVLKFPKEIAPVKVAVFPLLKNKPELVAKAREIYDSLKQEWQCEWDDNGNVGKRYRRQDEIGTPYCVTVDFDSLEDDAVTVRDRDTMEQKRVKINELKTYLTENLK
ncbi:MAG: glycine--tRNA ligase [Candidatus Moranbacteria bacterium RIFCSPHIGHO2_01_FULL_55_24]|nr:MAG: glycine--tRNA ligase [Candidatus Moranbacteria bacterium RIFCSPHIGHO2_01_FULL_55_24]